MRGFIETAWRVDCLSFWMQVETGSVMGGWQEGGQGEPREEGSRSKVQEWWEEVQTAGFGVT